REEVLVVARGFASDDESAPPGPRFLHRSAIVSCARRVRRRAHRCRFQPGLAVLPPPSASFYPLRSSLIQLSPQSLSFSAVLILPTPAPACARGGREKSRRRWERRTM